MEEARKPVAFSLARRAEKLVLSDVGSKLSVRASTSSARDNQIGVDIRSAINRTLNAGDALTIVVWLGRAYKKEVFHKLKDRESGFVWKCGVETVFKPDRVCAGQGFGFTLPPVGAVGILQSAVLLDLRAEVLNV